MHAVRVHEPGGPDVLQWEEVPDPTPREGQVRVRIEAAGLNFIDTYHRSGAYPMDRPTTIGTEAAGVVDAVGPGVNHVDVGQRVAFTGELGSYADLQVVAADRIVTVPDDVDLTTAAATMLQGMTAHYLTHDTFAIAGGHTALVHAAAGGVGHLLTQVVKLRGGRVIATCGTRKKAELAEALGADHVIVYTDNDFARDVRTITEGRGVDVVYDGVGQATFLDGLDCLRRRGMMVLYGQASGKVEPLDPQELNRHGSLFLTRPSLFHYVAERDDLVTRSRDLFTWLSTGDVSVRIDRTYPLREAADAHRYLEGRNTHGKVLLEP